MTTVDPRTPQPHGTQRPVNPRLAFWTSLPGILSMLVIAGAVVFLIAGVSSRLNPAADNFTVRVTGCTTSTSSLGTMATVAFDVTNTSHAARAATVQVEYRDADGSRLDTDTARVQTLQPGETARQSEPTLLDGTPTGNVACAVTGIS